MATYKVFHSKLPEGIDGETTVTTEGDHKAACELAAAHVASILRHRGIVPGARPEDVLTGVLLVEQD